MCIRDSVEVAHKHRRHLDPVDQVRPATDVHHHPGQRLVHRQEKKAVAADAHFVAQRLLEGLAEHQADVLDRVMVVHRHVPLGHHRQIEQPVLGEQREHVVEKRHAGLDLGRPAPVNREGERDVGLGGVAFYGCLLYTSRCV